MGSLSYLSCIHPSTNSSMSVSLRRSSPRFSNHYYAEMLQTNCYHLGCVVGYFFLSFFDYLLVSPERVIASFAPVLMLPYFVVHVVIRFWRNLLPMWMLSPVKYDVNCKTFGTNWQHIQLLLRHLFGSLTSTTESTCLSRILYDFFFLARFSLCAFVLIRVCMCDSFRHQTASNCTLEKTNDVWRLFATDSTANQMTSLQKSVL